MAIVYIIPIHTHLDRTLAYVSNKLKTENENYEEVGLYIQFVVTMDGDIGFGSVGKVTRCYGRRLLAIASGIGLSGLFVRHFGIPG